MRRRHLGYAAIIAAFASSGPVSAQELELNMSGFFADSAGFIDAITQGADIATPQVRFADGFGRIDFEESVAIADRFTMTSLPIMRSGLAAGARSDLAGINLSRDGVSLNGAFDQAVETTFYGTQRIAGFQGGLSVTGYSADDFGSLDVCRSVLCTRGEDMNGDDLEVGLSYFNQFNDKFSLNASVSYLQGGNQEYDLIVTEDPQRWSAGLNIGISGFTLGGSYKTSADVAGDGINFSALDVGATYEAGPWGFMLSYGEDAYESSGSPVLESMAVQGGVDFSLRSNFSLGGSVQYIEEAVPGLPSSDEDSTVVFIETMVSF